MDLVAQDSKYARQDQEAVKTEKDVDDKANDPGIEGC